MEFYETGGVSSTLRGTLRLALEGTFQSQPKGTPWGAENTPRFMEFMESHEIPTFMKCFTFMETTAPLHGLECHGI